MPHTLQVEVLFASAVAWCEMVVCTSALQVKDLQSQLKFKRTEVDDMLSAAQAKDRENSKLWEQVWPLRKVSFLHVPGQQPRLPALGTGSGGTSAHCMPALPDVATDQTRYSWPLAYLSSFNDGGDHWCGFEQWRPAMYAL